jgi:hypothetical protein
MVIHTEKKTVEIDQPSKIECDCCHKKYSLILDDQSENMNEIFESQEFYKIEFRGGYGSIFGDGAFVQCHLCQTCLKKLIGKYCKITNPVV